MRRCTAHPHVFAADDIEPLDRLVWVACGDWCPEHAAELERAAED